VVLFAGAAGMLHFEGISDDPQRIQTYPKALWWTAMQMTNIGTAYSIKTTGGRIICLGISVYAAAMFGYLTALFATFLIDRDAKDPKPEIARQKLVQEVKDEIIQLRRLIEEKLGDKGDISQSVSISKLKSKDAKELNHLQ
jgi:voltage-gated potassium channel